MLGAAEPADRHKCSWEGCERSYQRADHLERHQRTHLGQLDYPCHHCDKAYGRSDVLNRHLQSFHGEAIASSSRPRRSACYRCVQDHAACDGDTVKVCSRCRERRDSCKYPPDRDRSPVQRPAPLRSSSSSVSEAQPGLASAPDGPDLWPRFEPVPDIPDTLFAGSNASIGWTHQDPNQVLLQYPDFRFQTNNVSPTGWLKDLLLSATTNPAIPPVTSDPAFGMGNSSFDWGLQDLATDIFGPLASRVASPVIEGPQSPDNGGLIVAVSAEEVDGRPNAKDLPDGRPPESPWIADPPSINSDGSHVALPAIANQGDRDALIRNPGATVNPTARSIMQALTLRSHQTVWVTPDLSNFPSTNELTSCVNLYLANFAAWLPIIDCPRGTFRIDKAAPIVLKAVAAVGAVYARDDLQALAAPLAELVRRDVLFISERDERLVSELAVIQAALLHTYYATFSGTPRLVLRAEMERSRLVTLCHRLHLLDSNISAATHVRAKSGDADEITRAVKQDHRRRRLGWAIFLLDAQIACLMGTEAQVRLTDIKAPLPTTEPDTSESSILFSDVLSNLLQHGRLPITLDDIGRSCLAYALYRFCLDLAAPHPLLSISRATTHGHHPLQLLDQLSRLTNNTSTSPTALATSCTALAYHAHLQVGHPGLLDMVRLAAGKSGSPTDRYTAGDRLGTLLMTDARLARELLAYAAMLRCLCTRHTFDTPTEAVWLFDATLCLWACFRYGGTIDSYASCPGAKSVQLAWSWSSAIQSWIEDGQARISLAGVGDLRPSLVNDVLRSTANTLELMSWGLAGRYRQVLLNLAAIEGV